MQSLESSCQEADVNIFFVIVFVFVFAGTHSNQYIFFQYMLNEALQKLRRNPSSVVDQSLSLIDHTDYTDAACSSIITNPSISPPTTLVALKHHSVHHHSSAGGSGRGGSSSQHQQSQQKQHHHIQHLSGEKRGLSDGGGGAAGTASTSSSLGVSPAKRSKSSSSTVTGRNTASTTATSDPIATNPSDTPFFDIHDKLRELYALLYINDRDNGLHETRVS